VTRVGGTDLLLARELAPAVNTKGRGWLALIIGAIAAAIEHIVGRYLDYRCIDAGGRGGYFASCFGVDPEREVRLILCLVDGGISGRIDDDLRANRLNRGSGAPWNGEVQLRPADCDEIDALPYRGTLDEASGELAFHSRQEDLHEAAPSLLPAYRCSRIGRHHHSFAKYQSIVAFKPLSNVCSARQPSSRSILRGSIAYRRS